VSQHVMLPADLMTFKVRFESVSQYVMFLADLMTFKVRFKHSNLTLNVIRSASIMTC
jgi:hypothetical protein